MAQKKYILLVTGLSGAGKSEALHALEDIGFECIDNMPLRLVSALISDYESLPEHLALGVDVRTMDIQTHQKEALQSLFENNEVESHILYLYADADVLLKRFNVTRRRHPLAASSRPLEESIAFEEQTLKPLREMSDTQMDTTDLKPLDLWQQMKDRYAFDNTPGLQVVITTFGFKHGMPRQVDDVFDVRYLKNPHWVEELRPLTGEDEKVQKHVMSDNTFEESYHHILGFCLAQIKALKKTDRSYVNIGIGCTGGKHRSVTVAVKLAKDLAEHGIEALLQHRDKEKASVA